MDERTRAIVGRESERALLRLTLDPLGPLIVFIHGIGGVGKSALLEAFAAEARRGGTVVLRLDGGTIEPSVRGLLASLSAATGAELATVEDAATRLQQLGETVVVTVDRYEALLPIDGWLQQAFVPAQSDTIRFVLASRVPPSVGWSLDMGELFRSLPLANLPREDAEAFLRATGMADEDIERVNRVAHGHPLSLRLAAAALEVDPAVEHDGSTVMTIVEELTRRYLEHLDPLTRRVLDAASVVRRPTLSLLGVMLPDAAPQDSFERLRQLPFVELGQDGLILHDTIREVVAAYLRASDPERSRRYRIAAWRQLRDEVATAAPAEMGRCTADLLYILENPLIREAWFPTTERRFTIERAQPDEWPAIQRISEAQYPGASIADLQTWWERLPSAFRMARDTSGAAVGFSVMTDLERIPRTLYDLDPVARTWRDHLRSSPVSTGERTVCYRFERADPADPLQEFVHAALLLDQLRTWMDLRPGLRRHYGVGRNPQNSDLDPAAMGIQQIPSVPLVVEGAARYRFYLDFGPASVDGWLSRLIGSELQVEDESMLDVVERQLLLGGARIDLTRLEFGVFKYLYDRPGKTVERAALLRDVWGYEDAGGSNVIEALMKALRRKLGDRASAIETVRGVGYRFVAVA